MVCRLGFVGQGDFVMAISVPHAHACDICGAQNAPYGYRHPGPLHELPPGKRGYLWACEACRDVAEDRRAAALRVRPVEPVAAGPLFYAQAGSV